MHNIYKVGGHCFKVSGSILCSVLERMAGFAPFEVAEGDDNVPEFFFMEGKSGNIPAFCERQYVFAHEGVEGNFGCGLIGSVFDGGDYVLAYLLFMGLALPLSILAASAAYQYTRRADLSLVLFAAFAALSLTVCAATGQLA